MDETSCRLGGRRASCYRAIDQDGQVVDVYVSERRNAAAARAFFERAIAACGVTPERVVTDKALCYPPALRSLVPDAEHRKSKYLNNGLERDHGHLKQRLRPMRGFKQRASADSFSRGHALIRNLRNGCISVETAAVGFSISAPGSALERPRRRGGHQHGSEYQRRQPVRHADLFQREQNQAESDDQDASRTPASQHTRSSAAAIDAYMGASEKLLQQVSAWS